MSEALMEETTVLHDSPAPVKDILKQPICKANARELGRMGAEARKRSLALLKEQAAKKEAIAELLPDERYRLNSLARTRELIEKVETKLEKCGDPQSLNYISSSLAKLRDIEQKLADRPLPGSRRPGRESSRKSGVNAGPADVE